MKILFVCLGNICRSPLAEGIARDIIKKRGLKIIVDSAGTGDYHIGEAPCPNSIKVARENGVDISKLKARQVTKQDFKEFDLIVALDSSNVENLKKMGCQNLVKLGSYGFDGADVPDPYFFDGYSGFEDVYNMIEKSVNILIDDIS